MILRCDTCNGENEIDLSKENVCILCGDLINLDSEVIRDQLERRNLLHLVKSTEPVPDTIDLYWKKFKEYYWLILILSILAVWVSSFFGLYVWVSVLLLSIILMSLNIAYHANKISEKSSNFTYAFLGILTFNFPIGMMTIYFAMQNLYIKAKGENVPRAQKILVVVGVIFSALIYLSLIDAFLS
jgi:hypothetical protein